jgi:hypothetical protein
MPCRYENLAEAISFGLLGQQLCSENGVPANEFNQCD